MISLTPETRRRKVRLAEMVIRFGSRAGRKSEAGGGSAFDDKRMAVVGA
jgi:hypothetical protein